ncbi:MAG: PSD1 and planctomycete cytochrome C domain-containing protein [Phycisphaerales bacterium]|jgi:hypothetical protein|nr:PSD1 and planctomycete cytochrome C domain-containing protein [Phycisphaerales bacterium]
MLAAALLATCTPLAEAPDWAREVRPILATHCLRCHGADPETREADLRLDDATALWASGVLDRDDPMSSLLLERIEPGHGDPMPPVEASDPLEQSEIDTLRAWVAAGAGIDDHWSFKSPVAPAPPMLESLGNWPKQPLDVFVAGGLERAGLRPSDPASPARLLRRASLDLRGLPPSPEELDRFLADPSPRAYEDAVDRLLASSHYGEHWAGRWLDLARYADTNGYEQDGTRTIWPWRDWVIRAFNEDLPFNDFTIRQLAGDLLPDATDEDVLATAFHRNTMTNSEGGTRDEEFRVAAVVDRVNTTYEAWMGVTMACAQCHAHKYDPISQEDYYASYALLNQTQDADRPDDNPRLDWQTPEQGRHARTLAEALREKTQEILEQAPRTDSLVSIAWIDEGLPPGATPQGEDVPDARWPWRGEADTPPVKPHSGRRASVSEAKADSFAQHFFEDAAATIRMQADSRLVAHVRIDPERPPKMIMLQVHAPTGGWEHRAYWGQNHGTWGVDQTPARLPQGELPPAGSWVRLEIPAKAIDLPAGTIVDGIALSQFGGPEGGRVWWDAVGFERVDASDHDWQRDRSAWEEALGTVNGRGLLPEAKEALQVAAEQRSQQQDQLLELEWRHQIGALGDAGDEYTSARDALVAARMQTVSTPVMRALPEDQRRTTKVLVRGAWNDPADEVRPGIPSALNPRGLPAPTDRLAFARWIASPDNPLTARVRVNRLWESLFGRGIVLTSEDFGTQGELPGNQALLDHLAVRFIELGWSQKALLREILTSATYRQDSAVDPKLLERDPNNELLARGARFRLDAETIRDQALAIGGLLDPTLHGPPVFPAQPEGTWQVVYNGGSWTESPAGDRHRRGLYTFWRRTAPYPSMITFDAPSREFCVSRRIRTNTPLQALVVLNDPVYLEAAGGLAGLMLAASDEDEQRITAGFRRATGRDATTRERSTLRALLANARSRFATEPDQARIFLDSCRMPESDDPSELAAWIVMGNVLLNLDEVLVKS